MSMRQPWRILPRYTNLELKPCPLESVKQGDTVYTPAGVPRTVKSVTRDETGRLRMLSFVKRDGRGVTYVRTDLKDWTLSPPAPAAGDSSQPPVL